MPEDKKKLRKSLKRTMSEMDRPPMRMARAEAPPETLQSTATAMTSKGKTSAADVNKPSATESTRTRKGLFGREITVTKTRSEQKSNKGKSVDTTKSRTVKNAKTGNAKERYVRKAVITPNEGKSFMFKEVSKTKSKAPSENSNASKTYKTKIKSGVRGNMKQTKSKGDIISVNKYNNK